MLVFRTLPSRLISQGRAESPSRQGLSGGDGRDQAALSHLRDIISRRLRRLRWQKVRLLVWLWFCLGDWRRQVRLRRRRNVRLRRTRVGNVRHRALHHQGGLVGNHQRWLRSPLLRSTSRGHHVCRLVTPSESGRRDLVQAYHAYPKRTTALSPRGRDLTFVRAPTSVRPR
jgi:hypothetical protein